MMPCEKRRNFVAALSVIFLVAATFAARHLRAADTAGSAEERIAKVKADLKSGDVAVRQKAIGLLVHSDISSKLMAEMQEALADRDGAVRSVAATSDRKSVV